MYPSKFGPLATPTAGWLSAVRGASAGAWMACVLTSTDSMTTRGDTIEPGFGVRAGAFCSTGVGLRAPLLTGRRRRASRPYDGRALCGLLRAAFSAALTGGRGVGIGAEDGV